MYQVFQTQDDPITLALGNDAIWKRFWQAVGRAEIRSDPRYATNVERRAARSQIIAKSKACSIRGRATNGCDCWPRRKSRQVGQSVRIS